MPSPLRWPDAALAGLACSMRSMSGPAALAARDQISGRPRLALIAAAVGELGFDKSSLAIDRISPPALIARVLTGAFTASTVAGPVGAAIGGLSAAASTYSTWRIRTLVVRAAGLPDPVIGAVEDIVCYGLAALATQHAGEGAPRDAVAVTQVSSALSTPAPGPSPPMKAAQGLLAGMIGTATMTLAQGAELVLTRAEPSDAPARVADRLARAVGAGRIRRRRRPLAHQGMHWLYGSAWGVPYGLLAADSRMRPELSGPAFGLLVWSVGLAEQPALGVTDPPWRRSLGSLTGEALSHVLYGVGAGATLRVLRNV